MEAIDYMPLNLTIMEFQTTNYAGAYDYFSSSRKGKVTFEGWKKDYKIH